jgi:hypothetical protein
VLEAAIATPQINGPMTRRPVQKIAGMSCRQRFLIFLEQGLHGVMSDVLRVRRTAKAAQTGLHELAITGQPAFAGEVRVGHEDGGLNDKKQIIANSSH